MNIIILSKISIFQVKMSKRYQPATLISAKDNRLMYVVVKLLWLWESKGQTRNSPVKSNITRLYQNLVHRLLESRRLNALGMPLLSINNKSVGDFLQQQERLANKAATKQTKVIINIISH